jgi:DNA-binding beta-propeller fold protein YncE
MIDSNVNVVGEGPVCLSSPMETMLIGDATLVSNEHLYVSVRERVKLEKEAGNTVFDIDLKTRTVNEIRVPPLPYRVIATTEGFVYVSTDYGIAIVDSETSKTVDEISLDLPCPPWEMVLGPKSLLYVSTCESVVIVDTSTNSVSSKPIQFKKLVKDMLVAPNDRLYILHYDSVSVVDLVEWEVDASIILEGRKALDFAISDRGNIYVSCESGSAVVIDAATNSEVTSFSLPGERFHIAAIHNSDIFFFDRGGKKIVVLDTESNRIIAEVTLPE